MKNRVILALMAVSVITAGIVYQLMAPDQVIVEPIVYKEGEMRITSPAYEDNQSLPSVYTCDGRNISPPLFFDALPVGTVSLALIVDDPDALAGSADPGWVHWILYNIPPSVSGIDEDSVPATAAQGLNDWSQTGYGGPCPPSGTHRYVFTLYALDIQLTFPDAPTKSQLISAMHNHVIDQARLIGLYARS